MIASAVVLGAGAWGTAMAAHLARRSGLAVTLYARDAAAAGAMSARRVNDRYLPGVPLPASLMISSDLAAVAEAELLIVATPSTGLLEVVDRLREIGARAPLVWLCKGFVRVPGMGQPMSVALPHQAVAPRWPRPVGAISGPSFAEEVARNLPTALVVATTERALSQHVGLLLRADTMRVYESEDLTGVEIGGAVKNVLAIAAGASDGLGFGHNARAAIITRGLAETGRLSAAMGGRRETLMGLAGLGDLVLTCTGDMSRNRRVGLALAEGKTLQAILADLGHVAEGVGAASAVDAFARQHGVDMPICNAVYRVLYEGLPPRRAVEALLRREPRLED